MTAKERTQAAARIIAAHMPDKKQRGYCRCGEAWVPLHVAQELDKAGRLCALAEAAL